VEGREGGRKEKRKEGRKERKKEGRKEGRENVMIIHSFNSTYRRPTLLQAQD
jgi:hypothetical protein